LCSGGLRTYPAPEYQASTDHSSSVPVMPDNRASTLDEKAPSSDVSHSQAPKQPAQKETPGFFSRKKKPSLQEDHADDTAVHTESLVDTTPSVSFTQLFR
jgi:ATP-binding cassette subfamily B (MDR/TAP) protein 1